MKRNLTNVNQHQSNPMPTHFVGIDWADEEHEVCTIDRHGNVSRETLKQDAEAIEKWVTAELKKAGGPIAIIIEQSRGALVHTLMFRENVRLFPVNPKQFVRFRESFSNAGAKNDLSDARLLALMLKERIEHLAEWVPDDESSRVIGELCRARRKLVDMRTKTILMLTALLKDCFPQALRLPGVKAFSPLWLALLKRWPGWNELRSADRRTVIRVCNEHNLNNEPKQNELINAVRSSVQQCRDQAVLAAGTIMIRALVAQVIVYSRSVSELDKNIAEKMEQHPDAKLFQALPGAGAALAPRLLTAFGSNRNRFATADDVCCVSGIAPVTRQSGKTSVTTTRRACSKFLKQTFHEFADHARKHCPWSRAYYRMQREAGMKHNAAIRKLALRWIRILFVVWKTNTPYDAGRYLQIIQKKNPKIIPFLNS